MNNQHVSTRFRWLGLILFGLTIALALLWVEPRVAHGLPTNVIAVNTLTDEDVNNANCSLREAIIAANTNAAHNGCNAGSGADTINFSVPGTITLTTELDSITETLTINGNAGGTTISGNNSYRVLSIFTGSFSGPGPTVNLTDLTIANGYSPGGSGGIFMYKATVSIVNTNFISNSAAGNIGGAILSSLGNLNVISSTFSNNSAYQGGAIFGSGTAVTITQSTFAGNVASDKGGAVFVEASSGYGFIVINSTFYSNTAGYGGALVNQSSTILINDTLSNNRGITGTGGITNTGGTIDVINTIIANSIGNNCGNAAGAISNNGNNIDSGSTCGFGSSNGSMSNTNPQLGTFGNYGGVTKILPLLPNSPAINAGDDTTCATVYASGANSVDQRGAPRPFGPHCDIGAFEYMAPIADLSAMNNSLTKIGGSTHFTATISAGDSVVYVWNFGDGTATANGSLATHIYAAVGIYTARVTATNSISTVVATTPVTITNVPIADLSAINTGPTKIGSSTRLTATINAGSNVTYVWNFGDGTAIGSGNHITHTYGIWGWFTATVTATNSVSVMTATTLVLIIPYRIELPLVLK